MAVKIGNKKCGDNFSEIWFSSFFMRKDRVGEKKNVTLGRAAKA
jgi:hypothetical protein